MTIPYLHSKYCDLCTSSNNLPFEFVNRALAGPNVNGYRGNIHKRFLSITEAIEFMGLHGIMESNIQYYLEQKEKDLLEVKKEEYSEDASDTDYTDDLLVPLFGLSSTAWGVLIHIVSAVQPPVCCMNQCFYYQRFILLMFTPPRVISPDCRGYLFAIQFFYPVETSWRFYSLQLRSSLPTSIRHLNIANSEYDIDELFPD
ncbi:hypothetical protein PPL_10809 [Heterostelium album PN500]|uniref:Uncharacterized protein n=1 Tax=Heterostelium pallidum (strain ATCC 26659 / Pp 5 / PN500) TaxID=670386 RepID=D3BS17_HETP5|nr:hypothetical protein PPL_10809 [Heterostelium album PN500]EFA75754.1 hypothetical protein PPL_10809 [Heterostelium album PN500]|eukprot:XP_020427888.1 hypothetical protein PPL_10809 [Heterostelium album PN500]